MNFKKIAAAVALAAVAVNANAAFDIDGSTGVGTGNGSGSVVLALLNDTTNVDTSLSVDLGITTGEFLAGSVAFGNLLDPAAAAAVAKFVAASTGTISWDVVGRINDGPNVKIGFLSTVTSYTGNAITQSSLFSAAGGQGTWIASNFANANSGADSMVEYADATSIGGALDPNHTNILVNQRVAMGDSAMFDAVLFDTTTGGGTPLNLGVMTFDGASLEYAAVPVPAAVWLFGSALVGLVGAARRRAA